MNLLFTALFGSHFSFETDHGLLVALSLELSLVSDCAIILTRDLIHDEILGGQFASLSTPPSLLDVDIKWLSL